MVCAPVEFLGDVNFEELKKMTQEIMVRAYFWKKRLVKTTWFIAPFYSVIDTYNCIHIHILLIE